MTDEQLLFDVLKPSSYYDPKTRQERSRLVRIGTAFPTKDEEGVVFDLPDGVSISGRVIIMPRKKGDMAEVPAEAEEIPL